MHIHDYNCEKDCEKTDIPEQGTYRIALKVEGIWYYSVPWTSTLDDAIRAVDKLHKSDKVGRILHSMQVIDILPLLFPRTEQFP